MKLLKGRKLLIAGLALIFIFAAVTIAMTAFSRKTFVEGYSMTGYSEDKPYLIESAEELACMAKALNSGKAKDFVGNDTNFDGIYFKLTNDIDLGAYDHWKPIGSPYNFGGIFDGGGYLIKNLKCQEDFAGLFGCIGVNGEIKNLGIESGFISGKGRGGAGGIAGTNHGSIINCFNLCDVTGKSSVGGLTGINYGFISNCFNTGDVSGNSNVGGLVGNFVGKSNLSSAVKNCYNTGSVSGNRIVGGIAGGGNSVNIEFSYNAGLVAGGDALIGESPTHRLLCVYYNKDYSSSVNFEQQFSRTTVDMTYDEVLNAGESLQNLSAYGNTGFWVKPAYKDGNLYYPELSIFSNSLNPVISQISKQSVKVGASSEKTDGIATVSISNWTYGSEPEDVVIETDNYTEWEIKYKLAGEDDETAVADIPENAGNYIAIVFFQENDTYAAKIIDATFTIFKANPEYTVPIDLTAKEGQKLSDIVLPSGFSWADGSLSVGLRGEKIFTAKFTPLDTANYNILEVEITVTVSEIQKYKGLADVSINDWVYGSESETVVIETDDYTEWEIKYKLAGEDDETAVEDIPENAGNYIAVVFFQETDTYAARIIDVAFTIFKAKVPKPEASGSNFTYDKTEKSLLIEESELYTVSNNSATNAGTYVVKISLNDKENYEWFDGSYEDLTLELKILKANPAYTVPIGLTAKEGQKLSDIALPSGFSWADGNLSVGLKGENKFTAKFTPSDTANYNIAEVEITITVSANAEKPLPESDGLSGGAIAGIIIGAVILIGLIVLLIIVLVKRNKQKQN